MNVVFVPVRLVVGWQARLVDRFGGAPGLRDMALLEGAMDRPRNLVAYEPDADLHRVAAVYGVGLARAHAFIDGNKRIAFATMVSFLRANGRALDVTEGEATAMMTGIAAGTVDVPEVAGWLADRCRDVAP
jgi:death-on-curing protein